MTTPARGFSLVDQGDGVFFVTADSIDGEQRFTLMIAGGAGALPDDEATARATVTYLLSHQEASELPQFVEFADVLAAYPDATAEIERLRRAT